MQKKIFLGTLETDGYVKIESGKVLLSTISMQSVQSPKSAVLEVSAEDVGKTALLRGELSEDVLYAAEIVEVLSPVSSALFDTLLDKGVVSLEEFTDKLSDMESEVLQKQEKKRLCALVIGHKKHSPGAVNAKTGLTEFDFNEDLALHIEKKVENVQIQRIYRRTYNELPGDINALKPDFVVSLHCNAFNTQASGTEVLYYHKSEKGKHIATIFQKYLVAQMKLPDRGIKPKDSEDRGGYLLRNTNAPCIIAEPFFIDNDKDLDEAKEDIEGLAVAYAKAIEDAAQIV